MHKNSSKEGWLKSYKFQFSQETGAPEKSIYYWQENGIRKIYSNEYYFWHPETIDLWGIISCQLYSTLIPIKGTAVFHPQSEFPHNIPHSLEAP